MCAAWAAVVNACVGQRTLSWQIWGARQNTCHVKTRSVDQQMTASTCAEIVCHP